MRPNKRIVTTNLESGVSVTYSVVGMVWIAVMQSQLAGVAVSA